MATDELDLHNLGAYMEEPAGVASPDVAEENADEVAEETEATATDESLTEQAAADEPATQTFTEEDFSKLRSTKDKELADARAEIKRRDEELEALKQQAVETPSGPDPAAVRKFRDLKARFEDARDMAQNGATEDERAQGSYIYGELRSQVMQAEAEVVAGEVGLDPNSPAYRQALADANIMSSADIKAIAWEVKATSTPLAAREAALTLREKQVAADEKNLTALVASEVAKQVAAQRQESGVNATVGIQPGGTSDRQQVLKKYAAAKARGDIDEVLDMKYQYPYLG